MIEIMQAHWITALAVMATLFVTPGYWFLILPKEKAVNLMWITLVIGAIMSVVVLYDIPGGLGPLGSLIIAFMWLVPPTIVWYKRDYFHGVSQRPLIGLQVFRIVGGVFIIEMFRGHIPGSFAWPAGIGDILVGVIALTAILAYKYVPKPIVLAVLILGVADFLSAFFFGFSSFEGPTQLFAHGFDNQTNLFPTGLIPFFLVPYAIVFHMISFINLQGKK